MMTSQISIFVDFARTPKCRYLENETLFFLQIKKVINYTSRVTLCQKNTFVTEATFKEPTHKLDTSALFIDLIFTQQPNLMTESGVHLFLHPIFHHQIRFAKFNLEIIYLPPYVLIKMLILRSFDEQLMRSIGKGPF